ncbi:MAG: MOSC domain-containing protein [Dehalococcoidia bacterium]|nr:MOSC domain-containing protein [Dehalococcoidia bacterium]
MQQGTIVNLHLARVKGTPSDPVQEVTAISGHGLEGDRSCRADNPRQVLVIDRETLDLLEVKPGQLKENITTTGLDLSLARPGEVLFIDGRVTMEIVGLCEPCGNMDAIRPGLREQLEGRRGMLAMVINGGPIKVGDPIRLEP